MIALKLMKIALIILAFLAAFFPIYLNISAFASKIQDSPDKSQSTLSQLAKQTLMPDLVEHEGMIFERDPYWEEYEDIVYADVDGDAKDEFIVRFRSNDEFFPPAALTVIYGLNKGDKILTKTILGGETPKSMELVDADKDGAKDLILYDHAGNHYTVIMIYSFRDGEYKCLFENGTACYVYEVNTKIDPVRITIGRENWEKEGFCYAVSDKESLLEVWEWDGQKFTYSPSLSTSLPLTEKEAIEITWQSIKEKMEETKEEVGKTETQMDDLQTEYAAKAWIAGRRIRELFKKELFK